MRQLAFQARADSPAGIDPVASAAFDVKQTNSIGSRSRGRRAENGSGRGD